MLILLSECNVRNMDSPIKFFFKSYIWTSPYSHLGNTVTSILWPLFFGPAKQPYIIFLIKKAR